MKATTIALLLLATTPALSTRTFAMNAVAARWLSSSRLTPSEAANVLYREATGAIVSDDELFEAEKHLRSDGPVSPNEYVLGEIFTRLLRRDRGRSASEIRVEPPLLHWLESRVTPGGIELRGESLQLAVAYEPASAVVRLRHRMIHHAWEECEGELCLSRSLVSPRSDVRYFWSDGAGAALPACGASSPTLVPEETHDVSCVFAARPRSSLRITYAAAGKIAVAPARASASAVVNNPLELRLFE